MKETVIDYTSVSQRNFVSELEHRLKDSIDNDSFLHYLAHEISLDDLYEQEQYEKLYYTVALVNYLDCIDEETKLEYVKKYTDGMLDKLTFPYGVEIYCKVVESDAIKKELIKRAIPEFLKYNLVITDVGGSI